MARIALLLSFLLAAACGRNSFEGTFSGSYQGQPVTLTLKEDGDSLSGSIGWSGLEGQVTAKRDGDHAKGTVRGGGVELPFEATLKEDSIAWTYDLTAAYGQKLDLTLTRQGKGASSGGGEQRAGLDARLFGRWYSDVGGTGAGGNTVTTRIRCALNPDGTFEYGGAESVITVRDSFFGPGTTGAAGPANVSRGEWKTENSIIYSRAPGGQWAALGRYALSGNDLMLYGMDGSKALWSRE